MTIEQAEIVAEVYRAIQWDLETGSHEGNNRRSGQFADEHPALLKTINILVKEATEVLPDRFSF